MARGGINLKLGVSSSAFNYDVTEKMEALGCDPFAIMASIAMDEAEENNIRLAAARELAQYIAPKQKAITLEARGKLDATLQIVRFSEVNPEQAAKLKDVTPRERAHLVSKDVQESLPSGAVIEMMRNSVGETMTAAAIAADEETE